MDKKILRAIYFLATVVIGLIICMGAFAIYIDSTKRHVEVPKPDETVINNLEEYIDLQLVARDNDEYVFYDRLTGNCYYINTNLGLAFPIFDENGVPKHFIPNP